MEKKCPDAVDRIVKLSCTPLKKHADEITNTILKVFMCSFFSFEFGKNYYDRHHQAYFCYHYLGMLPCQQRTTGWCRRERQQTRRLLGREITELQQQTPAVGVENGVHKQEAFLRGFILDILHITWYITEGFEIWISHCIQTESSLELRVFTLFFQKKSKQGFFVEAAHNDKYWNPNGKTCQKAFTCTKQNISSLARKPFSLELRKLKRTSANPRFRK